MSRRHFDFVRYSSVAAALITTLLAPCLARAQAYDTHETARPDKNVKLWIPKETEVVRGVFILANAAGGDTREWPMDGANALYAALARHLGFAMLGTQQFGNNVPAVEGPIVLTALDQFAAASNRPELRNAPFLSAGFSAGGQFSYELNAWRPDRVIAFDVDKGGNYRTFEVSAAALLTPGIIVAGELDSESRRTAIRRLFDTNRPRGARWAYILHHAFAHNPGGTSRLFAPFFARVTALRYPADADPRRGPVALRTLPEDSGWLADNGSWGTGLTAVAAWGAYAGDRARASWLPDESTALIYRAFASYEYAGELVRPTERSAAAGTAITMAVDAKAFPWQRIQFFAGAERLGEVAKGMPPELTVRLPPGTHGLHVLLEGEDGALRTNRPVSLVVTGDPRNAPPTDAGAPDGAADTRTADTTPPPDARLDDARADDAGRDDARATAEATPPRPDARADARAQEDAAPIADDPRGPARSRRSGCALAGTGEGSVALAPLLLLAVLAAALRGRRAPLTRR